LTRWSHRVRVDRLTVRGRLSVATRCAQRLLPAGPVRLDVDGASTTSPLGHRVEAGDGEVRVLAGPGSVERLVSSLSDPSIDARAVSLETLTLRVGPLEVVVPRGTTIRLRAAAAGPPSAPVLSGPLEVAIGQAWLAFSGASRVRWLSSLARVAVQRVVLQPDGRIRVEGQGRRGMDRVVRRALAHASDHLSDQVRFGARFQRLRAFLA